MTRPRPNPHRRSFPTDLTTSNYALFATVGLIAILVFSIWVELGGASRGEEYAYSGFVLLPIYVVLVFALLIALMATIFDRSIDLVEKQKLYLAVGIGLLAAGAVWVIG